MQRLKVPDMSCAHCVQTIEKAIYALDPAALISCDLEKGEVNVETTLEPSRVSAALKAVGYDNTTLSAHA